jgi:hypothetical protein
VAYERPAAATGAISLAEVAEDLHLLDLWVPSNTVPQLLRPLSECDAPSANALIDGVPGTIPPDWWLLCKWSNRGKRWDPATNAMMFKVGSQRAAVRAIEIRWDRYAWQNFCRAFRRRRWAMRTVDKLLKLEEKTDPRHGEESARGKDEEAFYAMGLVGEFAETFAGWAVRHQAGLAISRLGHVGRMPGSFDPDKPGDKDAAALLQNDPDYLGLKATVDAHCHEAAGVGGDWTARTPDIDRQMLINVLDVPCVDFLSPWRSKIIRALHALDYGGPLPELFRPSEKGLRRSYEIRQLELAGIKFIAFWAAAGLTSKMKGYQKVAEAYGVGDDIIRKWPGFLRAALDRLDVSAAEQRAKNAGRSYRLEKERAFCAKNEKEKADHLERADYFFAQYSDDELLERGREYQQFRTRSAG